MGDATSLKIDGQLDRLLSAAGMYREARNGLRDATAECLAAVGIGEPVRNHAIVLLDTAEMRDARPLQYASVIVSAVALREAQRRLEDAAWECDQ